MSYRLVTLRSFYSAVPKIVILGPPASGKTTIVSASRHVCDTEAAPRRLPSQLSFSSLPSPASNLFSYCKRQCVFIVENLENTKKKHKKNSSPEVSIIPQPSGDARHSDALGCASQGAPAATGRPPPTSVPPPAPPRGGPAGQTAHPVPRTRARNLQVHS